VELKWHSAEEKSTGKVVLFDMGRTGASQNIFSVESCSNSDTPDGVLIYRLVDESENCRGLVTETKLLTKGQIESLSRGSTPLLAGRSG
jgi:hypothetical protein